MSAEQLFEDMREIRSGMTQLIAGQARAEQKIDGLTSRLYTDGGGAIPVLFDKVSGLSTTITENKSSGDAMLAALDKKVESQRAYVAGWATAVTVLLSGVKYALAKVHIVLP